MRFYFIFIIFFSFFYPSFSQNEVLSNALKFLLDNQETDDFDPEPIAEHLNGYLENGLLINSASVEELLNFPFFNSNNVLHVLYYRNHRGYFRVPEEFLTLPGFTAEKVAILKHFINYQIEKQVVNHQLKAEVIQKSKLEFQKRKGFEANVNNASNDPNVEL